MRWKTRTAEQTAAPPEPAEVPDPSSAAVQLIDDALRELGGRTLVTSSDAINVLLDVRTAITLDAAFRTVLDDPEMRDTPTSCPA